jgi:hypothetical protein
MAVGLMRGFWPWGSACRATGPYSEQRLPNGCFTSLGTPGSETSAAMGLGFVTPGLGSATLEQPLSISFSPCRIWLKVGRVTGSARQQARPRVAYRAGVLRGKLGRRPCFTCGRAVDLRVVVVWVTFVSTPAVHEDLVTTWNVAIFARTSCNECVLFACTCP